MRAYEFLTENAGTILDLTRNYGNFSKLYGKVIEVTPKGKYKIKIVLAEPMYGKKGAVAVGDVVTLAPNYVKQATIK